VAARTDVGLKEEYCSKWGGQPTADYFKDFEAIHLDFKGKAVGSALTRFQYFGCFPRVRAFHSSLKQPSACGVSEQPTKKRVHGAIERRLRKRMRKTREEVYSRSTKTCRPVFSISFVLISSRLDFDLCLARKASVTRSFYSRAHS